MAFFSFFAKSVKNPSGNVARSVAMTGKTQKHNSIRHNLLFLCLFLCLDKNRVATGLPTVTAPDQI